ncbi:MAG: iron complex outermembrane receptor protein [Myxococcota bacterium]|jgi:iron complex outermembrane receptor protein
MSTALLLLALLSNAAASCDLVVRGVVVDGDSNAPIAGAQVVVGPPGRQFSVVSDGEGRFEAPGQCAGFVRVAVSHPSFHAGATAVDAAEDAVVALFTHEDHEIVVTEALPLGLQDTRASVTLTEEELDERRGQDLAGTIEDIPGVSVIGGASATSKPVIRGQFGRRLLVLVDGVRHEGQKWGIDHAPEVDAFGADEITVIRGAAGVRYGADAVGGVILVDPHPMRETPGVDASVHSVAAANGLRGSLAGRVDAMSAKVPGLAVRLSANATSAGDQSSPGRVLGNTAARELNLGAAIGYVSDTVHARLSWDRFVAENGVFYGVRSDSPADFLTGLDAEPAVTYTAGRDIDRPRQSVVHDRVIARVGVDAGQLGHVDVTASYQHNHRTEADITRQAASGPQLDFTLRTTALDASLHHSPVAIGLDATLEGAVGVTGQLQENVYRGVPLVPNYRSLSGGVYAWERLWRRQAAVEVGARLDRTSRTAFLTEAATDRLDRRGATSTCERGDVGARCSGDWTAGVVTLGGLWGTADDVVDIKVDLSSGARVPSIDEQFLDGTAPTFPAFALGDPSLGVETTYTAGSVVHLHTHDIHGEIAPFASYVNDYIQFAPAVGTNGQPVFDVVSRGAFPRYTFGAVNALWYGIDGHVTLAPDRMLSLDLRGSMVRGQDTAGQPLAFVPADRAGASLKVQGPDRGAVESPYVAFDVDAVRRQDRVPEGDFAPAPDGYVLLGFRAGTQLRLGTHIARIYAEVANLSNVKYRNYTSLLRYYADEPGRDALVRASLHMHF